MGVIVNAVTYSVGTTEERATYRQSLTRHLNEGAEVVSTVVIEQIPQDDGRIVTTMILVTYRADAP